MGRRRDIQILAIEDESPRSSPQPYATHFRCEMDTENKIKFNPWVVENGSIQEIGSKPDTIRSKNESDLVIEISN